MKITTDVSLKARNFKCFGDVEQGFDHVKPLNILVGRNNAGKSALIDLLEAAINEDQKLPSSFSRPSHTPEVLVAQKISGDSLRRTFLETTSGGGIPASNHWDYGKRFLGYRICWRLKTASEHRNLQFLDHPDGQNPFSSIPDGGRYLTQLAAAQANPFANLVFRRLSAERNILPEVDGTNNGHHGQLSSHGIGGTNLIQTFLNKVNLPRDLVEITLLEELNSIFRPDANFTGIHCRQLEAGQWEVYLREEAKGAIPLSQSGSGLKTVILALLNIHVVPAVINRSIQEFIFAFEEPENNLHPALQRRLLSYFDRQASKKGCTFVLTTHSSVAIDIFNTNPDAQIIHVTHDGKTATARTVRTYIDNRGILDDLDVRASDLLQSNGVIWVEGPSDRIYLNRWISLWSDGLLKEGVHYQCVFYGGRLLAHITAGAPGEDGSEALPIFRVNRNAIVMIDSDKKRVGDEINATKRRIQAEVVGVGGYAWVTAGMEIENYIPAGTIGRWLNKPDLAQCDTYDDFFEEYLAKVDPRLCRYSSQKPLFAEEIIVHTAKADLIGIMDLSQQLEEVCSRIRKWNNL